MKISICGLIDQIFSSQIGLKVCCRIANSLNWHFAKAQTELIHKISPSFKIIRGPFKGMIYPNKPGNTSVTVAKFIGAYEQELHPILERCFEKAGYATVVNIGCGEGYYAVGSALRLPDAHIIAFDLSLDLGEQCKTTAKANGVEDRVKVFGACTPDSIQKIPDIGRSLILCDCEGAEFDLLHPESFVFSKYDILVETHDTPPNQIIIEALKQRFGRTHTIVSIIDKPRNESNYPELANLSAGDRWLALNEFRPFLMTWLWIEAK